ncbi:MAG: hypothetical protein AB1485_02020 [Candidatus Thermoplasmatota archaeon]
MSAELMATIIGTVLTVITLVITIFLTNRSTQKIIKEGNENTQKILDRIAHAIHGITHLTEKLASHSAVDLSIQGIEIAENVETEEEARKLGEVIKYNSKLKICYYRPKKSATSK